MNWLFWGFFALFVVSAVISISFHAGEESKDERGRQILSSSYAVAFPIALLGYSALNLYERWAGALTYPQLKLAVWILLAVSYSVHAGAILLLKRRL